ncbi:Hsp33 family molecular chaperone [Gilliamella sp. App2-1]|uniref:Hsp33 family molecular chaperone HslO n=1 Tax=Gilliamella sp. App2-1 TaxID=3120230 RepID=UPI000827C761|nr:Hsp33 family molecular chaperone HslO [Gilliamella apicola]OCG23535.1 Hsp33 family molecular chaperone [Gilliamella apicola]
MDTLNRFLFDNHPIRGEITRLDQTYQAILDNHTYPIAVQNLLGELLVVTSLLTATLKFEGDIAVQLQGDGALSLAVVNGNDQQQLRGVARVNGNIADDATLKDMVGNGYIVITITPKHGERYQGIVGLEKDTLIGCIENYFMQSEQLPTRLFVKIGVHDNKPMAAGILLQVLPANENTVESFEHLSTLTETITSDELFQLSTDEILYRLYNQEEIRLFETHDITFKCGCSPQRCEDSLMTLPANQIDEILREDGGKIDIHCDYCGRHYLFDAIDIAEMKNKHNVYNH